MMRAKGIKMSTSASTDRTSRIVGSLMLFAAALIWGSSFIVMKFTVDVFPPNLLLSIRFAIGAVLLCLVFYKRLRGLAEGKLWIRGIVLGTLLCIAYELQTVGLMQTTAGKNAFLTSVYCLFVPFFAWFAKGKRPDRMTVGAALLCIAGIGLVSLREDLSVNIGDVLTLASGVFYALHIVSIGRFARQGDPILYTIVQFVTAAVLTGAISLVTESLPSVISAQTVWSLLYLAVFATTCALVFQSLGQVRTTDAAASILLSLEAVFGVAFSVMLGGDVLTPRLVTGFTVIFVSILVSETKLAFLEPLAARIKRLVRAKGTGGAKAIQVVSPGSGDE